MGKKINSMHIVSIEKELATTFPLLFWRAICLLGSEAWPASHSPQEFPKGRLAGRTEQWKRERHVLKETLTFQFTPPLPKRGEIFQRTPFQEGVFNQPILRRDPISGGTKQLISVVYLHQPERICRWQNGRKTPFPEGEPFAAKKSSVK